MSLRLTDEEFDLALKPDVKSPLRNEGGHLRMVWAFSGTFRCVAEAAFGGEISPIGPDEWVINDERFPTEGAADARAREYEAAFPYAVSNNLARYIRAEFFPDYGGGA